MSNGLSSVTADIGSWPVVLITAPVDQYTDFAENPYAYTVPYSSTNPIRALVFDKNPPTSVKYTIDGQGEGLPMSAVAGNPHLWQTVWDATSFTEGEYTIEVEAVVSG